MVVIAGALAAPLVDTAILDGGSRAAFVQALPQHIITRFGDQ